jgi:hypothetical protein
MIRPAARPHPPPARFLSSASFLQEANQPDCRRNSPPVCRILAAIRNRTTSIFSPRASSSAASSGSMRFSPPARFARATAATTHFGEEPCLSGTGGASRKCSWSCRSGVATTSASCPRRITRRRWRGRSFSPHNDPRRPKAAQPGNTGHQRNGLVLSRRWNRVVARGGRRPPVPPEKSPEGPRLRRPARME